MLSLTRWTPSAELAGLHRDLDALFGRVFGDTIAPATADTFIPSAEVRRDGDAWMVSMAIPGISPDNLEIDVTGRTLRVRGERRREEQNTASLVSEISYGRFEREFILPDDVDADRVQAAYRNGMLELALPLKESAKPRRIEIQTAAEAKQLKAA